MRWKKTLLVGFPILALTLALIAIKFADTATPSASILGPDWQCRKLSNIEVCNHTSPPKLQRDASTRL